MRHGGFRRANDNAPALNLSKGSWLPGIRQLTTRLPTVCRGSRFAHQSRMKNNADTLMTDAAEGRLPKHVLAELLAPEWRAQFLAACASLEKQYTDVCIAKNDPCLESGCALVGETCLEPLLEEGTDYQKACGAEWVRLFANAGHRAEGWSALRIVHA
jgi:hypothetical protein